MKNIERLFEIGPADRSELVVIGPDLKVDLSEWVTSVPFECDYAGTATVTVSCVEQEHGSMLRAMADFFKRDPKTGLRRLKKWNVLRLHNMDYILRELHRTQDGFDLVFYDKASEDLKRYHGPIKTSRGRFGRAQVIKGLANEAGVAAFIPDQNSKQPIADLSKQDAKELKQSREANNQATKLATSDAKNAGLQALRKAVRDGKITVQGSHKVGNIQTQAMADALTEADALDVDPLVRLSMVVSGIGESAFDPRATDYKTHTHKGVFQSNVVPQFDTRQQAHYFLRGGHSFRIGGAIGLAKAQPNLSPGEIASLTEISDGDGTYYNGFRREAEAIIDAWLPGSGDSGSGNRTGTPDRAYVQRYEFTIAARENYWDAARRLADDVRWRRFAIFNHLVYASDFTLAQPDPYELDLDAGWIDDPGMWIVTANERIDELPLTGRLRALVPPGVPFAVHADDPLYGTWLSRNFKRDLIDPECNVTLTLGRPVAPLPEPASTVKRVTGRDPSTEGLPDTIVKGSPRERVLRLAKSTLSSKTGFNYYLAGGNTSKLTDPMPPRGYRSDCSQWIYAIYLLAGLPSPGINTFEMERKGTRTNKPKPGDLLLMNGHVELYVGDGRTIGHGSPPIDYSTASYFIANRGAYYVTYSFLDG